VIWYRIITSSSGWPTAIPALAMTMCLTSTSLSDESLPPPHADKQNEQFVEQQANLSTSIQQALQQNDYSTARESLIKLLGLFQNPDYQASFPDAWAKIHRCCHDLVTICRKMKDPVGVLRWNQEALEACRKIYPKGQSAEGNRHLAVALNNVGLAHYECGNLTEAVSYFGKAEESFRKQSEVAPTHQALRSLAAVLGNLGQCTRQMGHFSSALRYHEERVNIYRKLLTSRSYPDAVFELANALRAYGRALRVSGQYAESRSCIRECVALYRHSESSSNVLAERRSLAVLLGDLGLADLMLGDTTAAKTHLEEALAMQRRLGRQQRIQLLNEATILDGLLMVAVTECRFGDAQRLGQQIERLAAQIYPSDEYPQSHVDVASFALNIGLAHQRAGDLKAAERFYCRALSIWAHFYQGTQNLRGHPRIVEAKYYLGNLYQDMGQYDRAYVSYAAALKMARELFPVERYPHGNSLLSAVLQNMANHCWAMGETETAAGYYREFLQMNEALYPIEEGSGAGHPILQQTYEDWADFLMRERRFDEAEAYYQRALEMATSLYPASEFPDGHPSILTSKTRMAEFKLRTGQIEDAVRRFSDVLDTQERLLSGESPQTSLPIADAKCDLARAYQAAGESDRANELFGQALKVYRHLLNAKVFPAGHPDIARTLLLQGQTLADTGQRREAFRALAEAVEMECNLISETFDGVSDAQLLNLTTRELRAVHHLMSAWSESDIPPTEVYDVVWHRRGLAQRLMAKRQQLMRKSEAPDARAMFEEYVSLRRRLSRVLFISSTENQEVSDARLKAIRKLNERKEEIERQLGEQFGQQDSPSRPAFFTHEQLASSLPPNSVLIDFLQYIRTDDDFRPNTPQPEPKTTFLGAFVISSDRPVQYIDLASTEKIEKLVSAWREDIEHDRSSRAGHVLRQCLWDPIQNRLPDSTDTIYVCPDGKLSLIPWAALPNADSSEFLIQQYAIATVSSGQMLLSKINSRTRYTEDSEGMLLAVGDVNFGSSFSDSDGRAGLREVHWPPLNSSAAEVRAVSSLAPSEKIRALTGNEATPENVLMNLPDARWAHFATHGFFVDRRLQHELQLASSDLLSGRLRFNPARSSILGRNPFLLSGIILAGADGSPTIDEFGLPVRANGLLTAETIVSLDCRNLELVVLSACRTSLGEVSPGDGVFGLRNAFHISGARNVVASLWNVEDAATSRLMTDFYRFLWEDQLAPLQALRQAQLKQLHSADVHPKGPRGPRLTGTVPLPHSPEETRSASAPSIRNWAGFSLSGPGF
jgi:CHAT domain-containing protein